MRAIFLVLVCMLSVSAHALNQVVTFQVYSSLHSTDTYRIYKRPESACMYGMDDVHFDVSSAAQYVVFRYDASGASSVWLEVVVAMVCRPAKRWRVCCPRVAKNTR